jgi:glutamate synthase (NADPH) large chain
MDDIRPIVGTKGSDSMSLDNMVEGLVMGGAGLFRALRLVIPPAWQNIEAMDPDIRAFYEYNSMHMEPWDGPAGIVLTDGRYAVCTLDRNGLRPARWVLTKDRILTIASEVGVWQIDPANVEKKGRVRPGQMIAADLETGRLLLSEDIDNELKVRQPYRQWLQERAIKLDLSISQDADLPVMDAASLLTHQKLFNVSFEERDQIIRVLAEDGQEAIGSMGDDTPMAVLSQKVRSPFDYLRQQFAQVTNPPIDPIREAIVMSLNTSFGPERNLFDESAEHAHRVEVHTPLLSKEAFDKILGLKDPAFDSIVLDLHYDPAESSLEQAIHTLNTRAVAAVRSGKVILILSDRNIGRDRLPIHALFATGAVHHALIAAGLRCNANIVVETGSVRDPHHYACLIGYGATAVYPYLAYQVIGEFVKTGEIKPGLEKALCNFRKGMDKGLYKVLSKMGISLVASYRGAQLFEGVGMHESVVELCLKGTVSRISGANFRRLRIRPEGPAQGGFQPAAPAVGRRPAEVHVRRGIPRLQPGRGAAAAESGEVGRLRRIQAVFGDRQQPPGGDGARPDEAEVRRHADPAGGSRAAGVHPQALRLRRHVARRPCRPRRTRPWLKA